MERRDFLICNAISRHAFHCDGALVRTNTWKRPEQLASSHRVCNVSHTATRFWCTWFLLCLSDVQRGMMCQTVCLNPLSVQLLPQAVQRKVASKGLLSLMRAWIHRGFGQVCSLSWARGATALGWEGCCPSLG